MSNLMNRLQELDEKVSYKIYRSVPKNKKYKSILKFLEYSCNGVLWLTLTLVLIYLTPDYRPYTYLFGGLVLDIIYVALIKAYARRRRPTYAQQSDQLMVYSVDKHSLPSGHASRSAYIALFCLLFFQNFLLTTLITIWAVSVIISRVLLGRHHFFDVVSGCVLGYFEYFFQFSIFKFVNPMIYYILFNLFNDTNDLDINTGFEFD